MKFLTAKDPTNAFLNDAIVLQEAKHVHYNIAQNKCMQYYIEKRFVVDKLEVAQGQYCILLRTKNVIVSDFDCNVQFLMHGLNKHGFIVEQWLANIGSN